jgi:23S rRNA pseudouridine1911/1915/1917 synthase
MFSHLEIRLHPPVEQRRNGIMIIRKTITADLSSHRLDEAVSVLCEAVSKTEARRIIDRGGCAVNSRMVRIEVGVMEAGRFRELALPAESLLLEDDDLIAVNKPAGVNTQRTPYQLKGTLEYWVSEYFRQQGIDEPARVIHRLDRGTSGVMLFPKHRRAAAWLSSRFHDGLVEKRYLALVSGHPGQESWTVDGAIGKIGSARYGIMAEGRPAQTSFQLLATAGGYSLIEARPLTGRTHQIRVHLEALHLPIIGDTTYGGEPAARMMLHCASLVFENDKGTEIRVEAPPDGVFAAFMCDKNFEEKIL